MTPIEQSSPAKILDEGGRPVSFGWARSPLFHYDPTLIRRTRRLVSESDRYIVFSPGYLLIMEIMDAGFIGYAGISVVSLTDKNRITQFYRIPLPMGSMGLPASGESGQVKVIHKKSAIEFAAMEGGARIIKADIPKFGHHRSLRGELVLSPPENPESIVTSMPWRGEKDAFRYARRSPWYTAEGVIQFGASEILFIRGKAWGIFDWSRELRPRSDLRFWASAAGLCRGRLAGFSVGYGAADSGAGTENAFFLEGKLHKLDQVTFHISPANWLEPWRFTSNDNRLEMTFTPHQDRTERHGGIIHSLRRRQLCGFFSGSVVLDDGSRFEFENLTGIAERRKTQF
jgi:hypothetical protein